MTTMRTEGTETATGPLARPYLEVTLAALALVTIVAFESMAVSTAMPAVARELDAVRSYGFAFSVMLTAQLLGIVLAGVWTDRSGSAARTLRRPGPAGGRRGHLRVLDPPRRLPRRPGAHGARRRAARRHALRRRGTRVPRADAAQAVHVHLGGLGRAVARRSAAVRLAHREPLLAVGLLGRRRARPRHRRGPWPRPGPGRHHPAAGGGLGPGPPHARAHRVGGPGHRRGRRCAAVRHARAGLHMVPEDGGGRGRAHRGRRRRAGAAAEGHLGDGTRACRASSCPGRCSAPPSTRASPTCRSSSWVSAGPACRSPA